MCGQKAAASLIYQTWRLAISLASSSIQQVYKQTITMEVTFFRGAMTWTSFGLLQAVLVSKTPAASALLWVDSLDLKETREASSQWSTLETLANHNHSSPLLSTTWCLEISVSTIPWWISKLLNSINNSTPWWINNCSHQTITSASVDPKALEILWPNNSSKFLSMALTWEGWITMECQTTIMLSTSWNELF